MSMHDAFGVTSVRGVTRDESSILYRADGTVMKANPSRIAERFEAVDAREDTFGNELPELALPGFGETYDDCGEDIPRFCADCGATHTVGRTCYRSRCPRCGKAWARKQGAKIAAKVEATRRYKESKRPGWSGYKEHHLMLSAPEGFETFSQNSLDDQVKPNVEWRTLA
ncbi:MAG: hypothetical protein ABEI11_01370 [Haloarculaceae archaeon]